jgi:hypothetical protein
LVILGLVIGQSSAELAVGFCQLRAGAAIKPLIKHLVEHPFMLTPVAQFYAVTGVRRLHYAAMPHLTSLPKF